VEIFGLRRATYPAALLVIWTYPLDCAPTTMVLLLQCRLAHPHQVWAVARRSSGEMAVVVAS